MFHSDASESPSEPDNKTDPNPPPISKAPVKKDTRTMSYDSSDSDSDDDSKHLSLKHISNSVKRFTENNKKMRQKQSESESDMDLNSVKRFTENNKKLKQKQSESESDAELKKPTQKSKFECEKCKKKFKDSMAYEYHKISFHVESDLSPLPKEIKSAKADEKREKPKKRKSSSKPEIPIKKQKLESDKTDLLKSKCLTGIFRKTHKVSDHSDDDSHSVIASIKSTLSLMHKGRVKPNLNSESDARKRKPIFYKNGSDSEESEPENVKKSNSSRKKMKSVMKNGSFGARETSSEDSSSEEEYVTKKNAKKSASKPKQSSNHKTIESEFQSHSIDAILKSKEEKSDPKNRKSNKQTKSKEAKEKIVKKPSAATVTSDSEPEIVKKEIKTEPVVDIADSEDETTKTREKLFSTAATREKCENCNKSFKNLFVLKYHQLHCDISKSASNNSKTSIEKNILQIKKSSESPADKILKKLSEKVQSSAPEVKQHAVKDDMKETKTVTESKKDNKSVSENKNEIKTAAETKKENLIVDEINKDNKNTVESKKEECKACHLLIESTKLKMHIQESHNRKISIRIKKISKVTLNKFKEDLKMNDMKVVKDEPTQKSQKKSVSHSKKPSTQMKKTQSKGKQGKPTCPECGKKYFDLMALEYHKITFHVEEKETKLFSESIYNEQMNFDKNFLKMTESESLSKPSSSSSSSLLNLCNSSSQNAKRKSFDSNEETKIPQRKEILATVNKPTLKDKTDHSDNKVNNKHKLINPVAPEIKEYKEEKKSKEIFDSKYKVRKNLEKESGLKAKVEEEVKNVPVSKDKIEKNVTEASKSKAKVEKKLTKISGSTDKIVKKPASAKVIDKRKVSSDHLKKTKKTGDKVGSKSSNPWAVGSSGYCICDKPERDDMLG